MLLNGEGGNDNDNDGGGRVEELTGMSRVVCRLQRGCVPSLDFGVVVSILSRRVTTQMATVRHENAQNEALESRLAVDTPAKRIRASERTSKQASNRLAQTYRMSSTFINTTSGIHNSIGERQ